MHLQFLGLAMMNVMNLSRPGVALRISPSRRARCYGSIVSIVKPLAYDHHEPASPNFDQRTSPIIFLHGLFGSKKNNRAMSKALARDLGRHVYALDLRNHGDSPHVAIHDYTAMAEDVSSFINENKFTDTTIIGHSMGAKTAMTIALQTPDLLADVIAVDNSPVDAILGLDFGRYVRGMKKIDSAGVNKLADADKILQEFEESLAIRQFLLGNLHRPKGENVLKFKVPLEILGKTLDHMGDFPFKDPEKARFEKPTLFVRGTKSKYVADDVLPLIGRFFPRFRLVDIEAGHWVISEQPEAFRLAVVEFLKAPE